MKGSPSEFGRTESARPNRRRKPSCKLIGPDGNVYSIIGRVRRALVADGKEDRAREFVARAFQSWSYDAVLSLCLEYMEVR